MTRDQLRSRTLQSHHSYVCQSLSFDKIHWNKKWSSGRISFYQTQTADMITEERHSWHLHSGLWEICGIWKVTEVWNKSVTALGDVEWLSADWSKMALSEEGEISFKQILPVTL